MVDVTDTPEQSFGDVPTPAIVAPIEFTVRLADYEKLGGHIDHVMALEDAVKGVIGPQNDHILKGQRRILPQPNNPWPGNTKNRVDLT